MRCASCWFARACNNPRLCLCRTPAVALTLRSDAFLQLEKFLGGSLGTEDCVSSSIAPTACPWGASHFETVVAEICAEIQHSLEPRTMFLHVCHGKSDLFKLAGLFCFSSWIGSHIGDVRLAPRCTTWQRVHAHTLLCRTPRSACTLTQRPVGSTSLQPR